MLIIGIIFGSNEVIVISTRRGAPTPFPYDINQLLFANGTSPHNCIFYYKGTPNASCPADHPDCPGLWAASCGQYKLQYVNL